MKILVVDDEVRFASILKKVLNTEGYGDVDTALSAEEALDKLATSPVDVLVTDLRMQGMNGLKLMAEVKRRSPGIDVILMTAYADVTTAREALKRGALDYLVKPFNNEDLISLIEQARARRKTEDDSERWADGVFLGMVGNTPPMREVFDRVDKAARVDSAVLITGPSGTGKELVARAVHSLSVRHRGRFVVVHSAAIPETLLESELFGHEKGSFTGADSRKLGNLEVADGGTVFFDEICEMPLSLQPKLLRFLQEHQFRRVGGSDTITVDIRVIAATNRDVEEEVKAGRFREDLFYRLDVIRITAPPLRDRRDDIEPMLRYLLRAGGRGDMVVTPDAIEALRGYPWPGNVRELQNTIERAVLDSDGRTLDLKCLPEKVRTPEAWASIGTAGDPSADLDLASQEVRTIEEALRRADGNKSKAARLLGITRRRLYSRMQRLGLDSGDDSNVADA